MCEHSEKLMAWLDHELQNDQMAQRATAHSGMRRMPLPTRRIPPSQQCIQCVPRFRASVKLAAPDAALGAHAVVGHGSRHCRRAVPVFPPARRGAACRAAPFGASGSARCASGKSASAGAETTRFIAAARHRRRQHKPPTCPRPNLLSRSAFPWNPCFPRALFPKASASPRT